MATQLLNVTFDGINDVPRLPGQSDFDGSAFMGYYNVYYSAPQPGDDLDATASFTGSGWTLKTLRMAGDDNFTTIVDLDNGTDRRVDLLELGYNSDVELISTRVRYIFGWDGDRHEVTLGNEQVGSTFAINLYAKENVVTTGNAYVGAIDTGFNDSSAAVGDTITIGSGDVGSIKTGIGNDTIKTTNSYVQLIHSGDGNDLVEIGSGGGGMIKLGGGKDKIIVNEANPDFALVIQGGQGVDTIDFKKFSVGVTFSLNEVGAFQNPGAPNGDLSVPSVGYFSESSIENIHATNKSDTLTGDNGKNSLVAKGGADVVYGLDGNDTLNGGGGNDKLFGGLGRDKLIGGKGKDTLEGGEGNDTLRGQAGADVFVFSSNAGVDKISDYQQGIDLMRIADHSGGFASLSISSNNGNKIIVHDGGKIILLDDASLTLTAADFDFV